MRKLSMTAILAAALALVGCADGVKEVKGEKGDIGEKGEPGPAGPPGEKGEKGEKDWDSRHRAQGGVPTIIDRLVRDRRDYDQRLLQRHV
jgi:hypothetical protein